MAQKPTREDTMKQRRKAPETEADVETAPLVLGNDENRRLLNRVQVLLCRFPIRAAFTALGAMMVLVALLSSEKNVVDTQKEKTQQQVAVSTIVNKLENCTVSHFEPPPKTEWTTKPLWFPQFPDSLDDAIGGNLVNGITGLKAGAKSYYASSKIVRRCKSSQTETATCSSVHPVVDMRGGPEGQRDNFHSKIILILRNPKTAFAAHFNGKQIRYHNLIGQTPIKDWREFRNAHIETIMGEWKRTLQAWVNAGGYEIGMYLPIEHLFRVEKGPRLTRQMANLLKDSGFPCAPLEDLDCMWYTSIGGKEALERYDKYHYEYTDYIPGYTKDLQDFLLKELSDAMEVYKNEAELVNILQEYRDDIRDNLNVEQ